MISLVRINQLVVNHVVQIVLVMNVLIIGKEWLMKDCGIKNDTNGLIKAFKIDRRNPN